MQTRTGPELPEAGWFESRRHDWLLLHGIVALFGFGRRDVAVGFYVPPAVEPLHLFQRREPDGL